MICLYFVSGFYGYAMCAWIYGLFFGCYLYSSKIFCYSIVKTKQFSRTWSIVQASQSLPCLLGVILTGDYILEDTALYLSSVQQYLYYEGHLFESHYYTGSIKQADKYLI